MADTIDIPGFGSTKKQTVYAVSAGAVLLLAVVYYRSKKQAAAAQAASVAQAGTNEIDPATGYPYGSPEDAAALSTQASYYQATAGYGSGGGGSAGTQTNTGFVSNAAWAQAYEEYAVNNLQANANTVAAALGKYLTGQPLTQDQLNVVEQAIAFNGLPPIAGTNGYPPSYHLQSAPSGGGGGGLPVLKTGIEIHVPYNVQPGQLPNVASKFGISVAHILSLSENAGKTGRETTMQVYYIPYRTQPTDTLAIVAAKFGISPEHLAQYVPQS